MFANVCNSNCFFVISDVQYNIEAISIWYVWVTYLATNMQRFLLAPRVCGSLKIFFGYFCTHYTIHIFVTKIAPSISDFPMQSKFQVLKVLSCMYEVRSLPFCGHDVNKSTRTEFSDSDRPVVSCTMMSSNCIEQCTKQVFFLCQLQAVPIKC